MKLAMYSGFDRFIRDYGLEAAVLKAKRLGFSGVEIIDCAVVRGEMLLSSKRMAMDAGDILSYYGMKAACYSVGISLYRSDTSIDALKYHAENAYHMGSPYLHHTLYPGLIAGDAASFEDVLADILPRAKAVADFCKAYGLTVLYEDQGYYFNGVERFGRFFSAIREQCDNVGVCADLGNSLFVGCSPLAFVKAYQKDVRHVHIKDYRLQTVRNTGNGASYPIADGKYLEAVLPGDGDSAYLSCMETLRTGGYDGWYGYEPDLNYPEPFLRGMQRSLN